MIRLNSQKQQYMKKKKSNIAENRLFHALIFLFSAILLFSPLFFRFDLENIKSFGLFGLGIISFISSSSLFPAPSFLVAGIGGTLYNPFLVAIISSIGSTLGEGVGFFFGYSTKKISHPHSNKFLDWITKLIHHKHGALVIVALSFIPNPFFDVVGIIAGIALFPLKKFLMFVFIGRFARDLIIAYIGSTL